MNLYLIFIPNVIAMIGISYFLFLKNKRAPGVRLVPYILVLIMLEGLYILASTRIAPIKIEYSGLFAPPFALTILTILYLFVNEVIRETKINSIKFVLYFIPILILLLFYFYGFINPHFIEKYIVLQYVFKNFIAIAMNLFYFILLFILKNDKRYGKNNYSKFVSVFYLIFQTVWLYLILRVILNYYSGYYRVSGLTNFIRIMEIFVTIGLYFYLFYIHKNELIAERNRRHSHFNLYKSEKEKSQKFDSKLIKEDNPEVSNEEADNSKRKNIRKIQNFFDNNESVYLRSDFNLDTLQQLTQIRRTDLTQIFNKEFSVSFSKYLNEKRIKYACKLIENDEDEELTVVDLTQKCGYKSRTSFYKNFEIETGMSVNEYREKLNSL